MEVWHVDLIEDFLDAVLQSGGNRLLHRQIDPFIEQIPVDGGVGNLDMLFACHVLANQIVTNQVVVADPIGGVRHFDDSRFGGFGRLQIQMLGINLCQKLFSLRLIPPQFGR